MTRRHAFQAAFLGGLLAIAACGPIEVVTTDVPTKKSPGPRKPTSPKPSPEASASPSASPLTSVKASPVPKRSAVPSAEPSVAPSPVPSVAPSAVASLVPSTTPSAAASAVLSDEAPAFATAAAAFPFTEVGAVRTYTMTIKAGAINLPGFRKTKVLAVTETSAQIWVSQMVDMSKAPLPGAGANPPTEEVLVIPRDGRDPHFFIDNALFGFESTGQSGTAWVAEPRLVLGAQAEVVRKRFKAAGAAETDVDYGLLAGKGLVHAKLGSKKLPASLLPPQAAMLASLGMNLELALTTDDAYAFATADPPTSSPGPSTSPSAAASVDPSASPSTSPSTSPSASPSASPSTSQ